MNPVIPCSLSNVSLIPGASFTLKKNNFAAKCNFQRKIRKQIMSTPKFVLPSSNSMRLIPKYRCGHVLQRRYGTCISATGTDVAIEEQDTPVAHKDSNKDSEGQSNLVEASETSTTNPDAGTGTAQSRKTRPGRKSEMPKVKNDELVPGATFTGKVRAIQPFGAFVDFGAFTDGLVHVSRLSDSFVKDVSSVVSIGQEVKVRLVEANIEAGRISLTMRENDEGPRGQPPKAAKQNTSKPNQRRENMKHSKFVKGQDLQGTVKNLTRSGAFISLPDDKEGFLPTSEEADDGLGSMMGGSSLQAGQEVSVRVLRLSRGQVTLTMKKEVGDEKYDTTPREGVVHAATNPFVVAFHKNSDIAAFLDEKEEAKKAAKEEAATHSADLVKTLEVENEDNSEALTSDSGEAAGSETVDEVTVKREVENSSETRAEPDVMEREKQDEATVEEELKAEQTVASAESEEFGSVIPSEAQSDVPSKEEAKDKVKSKEDSDQSPDLATAQLSSTESNALEEVQARTAANESLPDESVKANISPALVKQLREETGAGMMDCKNALSETEGDIVKAQGFLRKKGLASAEKKASRATAEGRIGSYIHDSRIGVLLEVNCETDFVSRGEIFKELVNDLAMQVAACPQVEYLATEDVPEEMVNKEREIEIQKEDLSSKPEQIRVKIVEGRIRKRLEELALLEQPYIKDDKVVVKDLVKQTIATVGENIKVKRFVRYNLGEGLQKKSQDFTAEVAAQTTANPSPEPTKEQLEATEAKQTAEKPAGVAVSAALVKQLREETGAGMMDCKKALSESGGDIEKAQEYLRKKGLSTADKKSSRLAAEGRIGSYIHDSRIGVLIEVNCETDFVARSEKFKELVDDLAMQVVACPQVQFVSIDEVPESIVKKEKDIEMQREDILSKPENIRERIVEGRISKRLGELALLEQAYIKDNSVVVKDLVKQTVATLGENIKVRRFVRFTLGETTEAEVGA